MTEWIYMRHPETGGVAEFPAGVQEGWEARGWEKCEAPNTDPDLGDPPPVDKPATTKTTAKDKKEQANG